MCYVVADRVADAVLSATNRCGLYVSSGLQWWQMVADKTIYLQPLAILLMWLIYKGLTCAQWAVVAEWQIKKENFIPD